VVARLLVVDPPKGHLAPLSGTRLLHYADAAIGSIRSSVVREDRGDGLRERHPPISATAEGAGGPITFGHGCRRGPAGLLACAGWREHCDRIRKIVPDPFLLRPSAATARKMRRTPRSEHTEAQKKQRPTNLATLARFETFVTRRWVRPPRGCALVVAVRIRFLFCVALFGEFSNSADYG
jgi:hypothetical protein